MSVKEKIPSAVEELRNEKNIKFKRLLHICVEFFGDYRQVSSSHHIFKMPWNGGPWVNLQRDKKNSKIAKPYQVKQVKKALLKLEEVMDED